MFDIIDYLRIIEHKKSRAGNIETSDLKAFKIDDNDGIAKNIGFSDRMINKVDYFLEDTHHIQLIELSDLRKDVKKYDSKISDAINNIISEEITDKYKREKIKIAKNEAWKSLRDEFCKKWNGSIAVIERLYRKTNQPADIDPKYSLLIVCVNETDIRILNKLNDEFTDKLNGMMNEVINVRVCNTKKLPDFVISARNSG
jgi:hypothetical protein